MGTAWSHYIFQSTLPIQGETRQPAGSGDECYISIHSPYTGRDAEKIGPYTFQITFQSTLPIQGETAGGERRNMKNLTVFQSTLPIQGETTRRQNWYGIINISIHSPYTGRDELFKVKKRNLSNFNPLSLYRERP